MTVKAFFKLIKQNSLDTVRTKKGHYIIVDSKGNALMSFAIKHTKNGKDEILATYVDRFHKLLGI